jgi:hypothetical protein
LASPSSVLVGQEERQRNAIELNTWVHIALVLDTASRSAVLYINGKEAYSMQDLPPHSWP